MQLRLIKTKLTQIQKICLAGILTALVTILQKVLAVNYIPGLPFVRLSFGGPALIMFASILLGPWYGLLVGAASDILGYFIFDMSGFGWFPQITAIYALLGFASYFAYAGVKLIKSKKLILLLEGGVFVALFAFATTFLALNNEIELWVKILVPCCLFALTLGLSIFIILYGKKVPYEAGFNVYQISLASFALELIVMLGFGCLMKACAFGFDMFIIILVCQAIVMFFNIALETVIVSMLLKITKRFIVNENK